MRERIFLLLDATQTALGGASGKFPQYYSAYYDLVVGHCPIFAIYLFDYKLSFESSGSHLIMLRELNPCSSTLFIVPRVGRSLVE